jgi:biopolymer transport protein ExbD
MGFMKAKQRWARERTVLQLTALIDVFAIILVFLLMSFQAADRDFLLHADVSLPTSSAVNPFKAAVHMAVTMEAVFVEGKMTYLLENGEVADKKDVAAGRIEAISEAVAGARRLLKREKRAEDIVVIQADKKIPYQTVHAIMQSAAQSGFYRFRLAAEKR